MAAGQIHIALRLGQGAVLGYAAASSLFSGLRTVLAEHSKLAAIRRRLAPPSRILRIDSTWWGLNFRGGPKPFPCLWLPIRLTGFRPVPCGTRDSIQVGAVTANTSS